MTPTPLPATPVPPILGPLDLGEWGQLEYVPGSPFGPRPNPIAVVGIGSPDILSIPNPTTQQVDDALVHQLGHLDVVPARFEKCVDKFLNCPQEVVSVYSPFWGCLYHDPGTTQVVMLVSRAALIDPNTQQPYTKCTAALYNDPKNGMAGFPPQNKHLQIILTHLSLQLLTGSEQIRFKSSNLGTKLVTCAFSMQSNLNKSAEISFPISQFSFATINHGNNQTSSRRISFDLWLFSFPIAFTTFTETPPRQLLKPMRRRFSHRGIHVRFLEIEICHVFFPRLIKRR
jgi:hypothetical protein